MDKEQLLINKLREKLQLSKSIICDKALLNKTKGTFLRARIELYVELQELKNKIKSIFTKGNEHDK